MQGGRGVCIIYFSGNNLYYSDEAATFEKIILINNRYEWKKRRAAFDENISVKEIWFFGNIKLVEKYFD